MQLWLLSMNDALESTSSSAGSTSGLADHKPLPYTPSELATCAYGSKSPTPALFNSSTKASVVSCNASTSTRSLPHRQFPARRHDLKHIACHQTSIIILRIGGRSRNRCDRGTRKLRLIVEKRILPPYLQRDRRNRQQYRHCSFRDNAANQRNHRKNRKPRHQ